MKNVFFKIMAGAAAITALASCNLNDYPTFQESDSFVAMDKSAIIVDETVGTITIPVTIASIDPIKTAVTYEVVEHTAKLGTDFTLEDDSAVLTFDGKERTKYIVVDIANQTGKYTGDLSFTINLLSAGKTLNLGANASCTVKISDLDHPLGSILGSYTAKANDYFEGGATVTWTLTMYKDDVDTKVVWIDGITAYFAEKYPSADFRVYGNVSADLTTISIPLGQVLPETAGTSQELSLWGFDGSGVSRSGNLEFTFADGVWTLEGVGLGVGYATASGSVSLYDLYNPDSVSWTKN